MMRNTFRAAKPYRCDGGCGHTIRPGEQYVRSCLPPWEDYETDVDDEGRTIGSLRAHEERGWATYRLCFDCNVNPDIGAQYA